MATQRHQASDDQTAFQKAEVDVRLSEDAFNRVSAQIVDDYFMPVSRDEAPTAFLIVGQPGAGKSSHLKKAAQDMFASQGKQAVEIDYDALRPYHPHYDAMLEQHGEKAESYISRDVSAFYRILRARTIAQKKNIIHDMPVSNPNDLLDLSFKLKKQGFRVEVHAMAVQKKVSRQGIRSRYEDVLEKRLAAQSKEERAIHRPRLVDTETHDRMYDQLPQALQMLEEENLVDHISLWKRGEAKPAVTQDYSSYAKTNAHIGQKLEELRDIPLTAKERKGLALSWDKIVVQMKKRDADKGSLSLAEKERATAYMAIMPRKKTLRNKEASYPLRPMQKQLIRQFQNHR